MGIRKMKQARFFAWLFAVCLLFSSCGAINDARVREDSKKRSTKTASHKTKHPTRQDTPKEAPQEELHYSTVGVISKYEKIIGIDIPDKSAPLYGFIDRWIGVPYCYGGMTLKCTDCSGFVMSLFKDVYNKDLPHIAEKQYDLCHKVKKKNLREGDLVFFDTEKGSSSISHVGVYLGNNKFVHASSSKGVRIDDLDEEYYTKAFVAGGSLE